MRVSIIGAGASGLVAAVFAARGGAEVTLFEKHPQAGRKILATGNGRCNVSNLELGLSHYHGEEPLFAADALNEFGFKECGEFFNELGIEYKIAENGRAYPLSQQSSSVVEVLLYELESLGVKMNLGTDIKKIEREGHSFKITDGSGKRYLAQRLLIASGGKAAPGLSSDGDGYMFAQSLGHRVTETFPSLVQLKLRAEFLKRISGVKIDGVIEVIVDGVPAQKTKGDILFTDYGISGSAVLDVSRTAAEALLKGKEVFVSLDGFAGFDKKELDALLQKRFETRPKKDIATSLIGLVNKKLAHVIAQIVSDEKEKNVANLSKKERRHIVELLKEWRFRVTGTQDFKRAEVTSGGVDVKEVDAKTMESKLQKGLYFAGEVLDIDGDCGGYNLHWAWASGRLAGKNMAKEEKE